MVKPNCVASLMLRLVLLLHPSTAAVTADGDFCPTHKCLTIWLSLCQLAPFQLKSHQCKRFFYIFKCFSLCLTVASAETLKRWAFFMRWQMEIFTYLIGILKCGAADRGGAKLEVLNNLMRDFWTWVEIIWLDRAWTSAVNVGKMSFRVSLGTVIAQAVLKTRQQTGLILLFVKFSHGWKVLKTTWFVLSSLNRPGL